jgi:hypothetical protein
MKNLTPEEHCCDDHSVLEKIRELYRALLAHDGFGELRIEIRILKRGQKEVILHCGKQYRFVVDAPTTAIQAMRQESYASPRES